MLRVIVTIAAVLSPMPLYAACSCPRPSIEDLIDDKRDLAIFSARVISILTPETGKPAVTRLQVGEIIRGEVPRVVEMTGLTLADDPCGVDFRPGEVRTLAAYKKDGRWFTDMCLVPRL